MENSFLQSFTQWNANLSWLLVRTCPYNRFQFRTYFFHRRIDFHFSSFAPNKFMQHWKFICLVVSLFQFLPSDHDYCTLCSRYFFLVFMAMLSHLFFDCRIFFSFFASNSKYICQNIRTLALICALHFSYLQCCSLSFFILKIILLIFYAQRI